MKLAGKPSQSSQPLVAVDQQMVAQETPQKKRKASEVVAGSDAETPDMFFKDLFKRGKISAKLVQQGCEAVLTQTLESQTHVSRWAKSGNRGGRPQHIHRDLIRSMSKQSRMPQLYQATAKFWDPLRNSPTEACMNFLLPHEVQTLDVLVVRQRRIFVCCKHGAQNNLYG